ncbi:hypothetical protein DOTSEDRAFT_32637 [Dothistroma septosporum NZE10]|uniref:Uncharacterized protein n=1 Tax=Dothistroma septosporum (strain NZE10 / CBS 128990) TaxID=675120 RepID=N1PRB8_DOTSN|nr:hypothetical protein DOTSEDRAFT_32637 [Dothistroma septosporum NZE10]
MPAETVAFILPMNTASDDALRIKADRFMLHDASTYRISKPSGCKRRRAVLAKLSSSTHIGRWYHIISTARGTCLRLTKDMGVEPQHFYIRADANDGTLLLTDVSKSGLWYSIEAS